MQDKFGTCNTSRMYIKGDKTIELVSTTSKRESLTTLVLKFATHGLCVKKKLDSTAMWSVAPESTIQLCLLMTLRWDDCENLPF